MAETYWLNEEDIRGREAWFYFQRSFPYDMIPAGTRRQAIYEIKSLERRAVEAKAATESKRGASMQKMVSFNRSTRRPVPPLVCGRAQYMRICSRNAISSPMR